MQLPLQQIAEFAGVTTVVAPVDPQRPACGITWDSREVAPGNVYVALPGERVDGHDFVGAALEAGAAAVLIEHDVEDSALDAARRTGAGVYRASSSREAFTALAAGWRTCLAGRVVGITGSSGKTTTKNLVRDVLAARFSAVATKANQNNELGVPRTLLNAEEGTEMVVVEMGMRGLGQIEALCRFVKPDWALITNVGESHIELLGSRKNIARAKAEIVEALPERGIAFLNGADEFSDFVIDHAGLGKRTVETVCYDGSGAFDAQGAQGWRAGKAVWAEELSLDEEGRPSFELRCRGFGGEDRVQRVSCVLSLRGAHNVSNACSAAAVGLAAGMDLAEIATALEGAQPESGRQDVSCSAAGVTVIDDAYNANPDSMKASLGMFAAMKVPGRRIAVLGDMGELGSFAAEGHRRVGALAASAGIDRLITVGTLARGIASAAREAGMSDDRVLECATRQEALEALSDTLEAGDAVLVKASHSMGLDAIAKELLG